MPLKHRPVVVGPPAGLVAGYFLAEQGYRPIVLERGPAVRERIRDVHRFDSCGAFDPESNYLFGEGGAGTFSDGKLTCRSSGPDIRRVLELFAECKGKPSILYDYRPHLGSNRLPAVVKAIRRKIESLGGEVRFHCRVEDIIDLTLSGERPVRRGRVVRRHRRRRRVDCRRPRARHDRDVRSCSVPMVQKPFQMADEQPQEIVNRAGQCPTQRNEARLRGLQSGARQASIHGTVLRNIILMFDATLTNGMSLSSAPVRQQRPGRHRS